jgi:hypothetical protein
VLSGLRWSALVYKKPQKFRKYGRSIFLEEVNVYARNYMDSKR